MRAEEINTHGNNCNAILQNLHQRLDFSHIFCGTLSYLTKNLFL